jgi:hypothetical protein
MEYSLITDISILNSCVKDQNGMIKLINEGYLSDPGKWDKIINDDNLDGMMDNINSRMKYSMSRLSLGIYNVLDAGPYKNLQKSDEIYLFTGFAEIETVNKIGKLLMEQNYSINPALFPNSVAHVALSYFAILKKISNYTVAINDGQNTNYSFINFIMDRTKIPLDFVVASGEENSLFFSYEINNMIEIVPSFTAYKIKPEQKKGFKFIEIFNDINDIIISGNYISSQYVFCDRVTFLMIRSIDPHKKIYSEYPIVRDNPCGIIYRLAIPFYAGFEGKTLVIEKFKNMFYLFEVCL